MKAAERTAASANGRDPDDPLVELAERGDSRRRAAELDGLDLANSTAELLDELTIVGAIERGEGADSEFDLTFKNGAEIQGVKRDHLFEPRRMQPAITQATKRKQRWKGPKDWHDFGQGIVIAAVADETVGGRAEETREWLAEFLVDHGAARVDLENPDQLFDVLVLGHEAFRGSDGRTYLRTSKVLHYVNRVFGQRTTSGDLRRRLARLGFERLDTSESKLSARRGDRSISRRFLRSAPGFSVDG